MSHQTIIVLDFGSQYTQLIARRLRELSVYSEICRPDTPADEIRRHNPVGVILSGGPKSVSDPGAPKCDPAVFAQGIPVLGICYGMQLMADTLGGRVAPSTTREFGYAEVTASAACRLLDHIADRRDASGRAVLDVWMSHGDRVEALPEGFTATAQTHNAPFAAMKDEKRGFYGVQFHPESIASEHGHLILKNFLDIAATWNGKRATSGQTLKRVS